MSQTSPTAIKDAVNNSWIAVLPASFVPFAQLMRLDRPIGWWLLLLPCWWSLALAQIAKGGGWPNLYFALLLLLGAIVMRGAGCVLNDLADRDIDAKVERTSTRPLPSGRVTAKAAIGFFCVLMLIGLCVLVQFNALTIKTAIASLAMVAIYPFMKRITFWPQFVLGLAFNWGAIVGWTAIANQINLPCITLYAGGILWTLAYDTIYAHQDKEDDAVVGVKSTALLFGKLTVYWLVFFFAASLALIDTSLWLVSAPLTAHIAIAAAAFHAAWQVSRFDDTNAAVCLQLFRANRNFGAIILFGMLLGCLI